MEVLPGDPLRTVMAEKDGQTAAIVAEYVRSDDSRRMSMFLYHRELRDLFDRLERDSLRVPPVLRRSRFAGKQCLVRQLLAAASSLVRWRQPPALPPP